MFVRSSAKRPGDPVPERGEHAAPGRVKDECGISLAFWRRPRGGGGAFDHASAFVIDPGIYLVMIRPQQKRQKQWQEMLGGIKTGDR